MSLYDAEARIEELENEEREVLEDYNSTAELVKEALEEQDLATFKKYSSEIIELLNQLEEKRDEMSHLGNMIDNAVDDSRMGDW